MLCLGKEGTVSTGLVVLEELILVFIFRKKTPKYVAEDEFVNDEDSSPRKKKEKVGNITSDFDQLRLYYMKMSIGLDR